MTNSTFLKPDITGVNPDNLVQNEKYAIDDYNQPYIRPDFTPFYSQGVVVKDNNGQILKLNTDYEFIQLVVPLVEKTGLEVYCFLKIINNDIFGRGPLDLTYQSFGLNQIPRSIQDIENLAESNDRPVDYNTGIKGKPKTFPFKKHLHSVTTETKGWEPLIEAIDKLVIFRTYRSMQMYSEMKSVSDNFWSGVQSAIDGMSKTVWAHTRNYSNPHKLTKYNVALGNVDNYKTGTTSEQIGGTAKTLVTAEGSKKIADSVSKNNDTLYTAGSLPFSYFGNNSYLNPNITADISGSGFGSDGGIFIKESDGSVAALLSRYNGKKTGLYYYELKDDGLYPISQQYVHPVVTANGSDTVTNVIRGSNRNYAMFTNKAGNKAYIAQMNSSLDPSIHVMAKLDLSSILTTLATINGGMPNDLSRWEDYCTLVEGNTALYLFITIRNGSDNYNLRNAYVYKLNKIDVVGSATIKFSPVSITYTPWGASASQTNSTGLIEFVNKTVNTDGTVSQFYANYSPALTAANNNQSFRILSGRLNQNSTDLRVQFMTELTVVSGGVAKSTYVGAVFVLDESAMTFTPDPTYTLPSFNFSTDDVKELSPNYTVYNEILKDPYGIGLSVLSDGRVMVLSANYGELSIISGWGTTPYQIAAILPKTTLISQPTITQLNVKQNFAEFNYHNPMSPGYDKEGVFFQALVDGVSQNFFTYATGPFTQRADLANENATTTYGFGSIKHTYKVSGVASTARITFVDESNQTTNPGSTQWNPLTFVSSSSKAFSLDDLTDQFMNNGVTKTQSADGITTTGDGTFTYWASGMLVDIVNWLTKNTPPKSLALEIFFVGDTGLTGADGETVKMPVFANILYSGDDNIVYNAYGVCTAEVGSEIDLNGGRESYRVIGLELGKSIYVDGYLTTNNDNDLQFVDAKGNTFQLLLGASKNTSVTPSDTVLSVRYFDYPFEVVKSDGNAYELQINPFPYDTNILSGVSSRKLVTANPELSTYGFVNYKASSDHNGSSTMTVLLSADKQHLSFYLKSSLNIKDTLINRRLYTYARHVMTIADGTNKGIESEAYRQVYDETIGSLNELTAMPGVGEVTIPNSRTTTGMTGIFAKKGNNGYWVSTMIQPNNWSIYFNDAINVSMGGTIYTLEPTVIDLSASTIEAYIGVTLNIYVVIERGKAKYLITQHNFPVNNHLLYIGSVTTGVSGITTLQILEVFMINDRMISETPRGSAVPATSGLPTQTVNINWY